MLVLLDHVVALASSGKNWNATLILPSNSGLQPLQLLVQDPAVRAQEIRVLDDLNRSLVESRGRTRRAERRDRAGPLNFGQFEVLTHEARAGPARLGVTARLVILGEAPGRRDPEQRECSEVEQRRMEPARDVAAGAPTRLSPARTSRTATG